MGTTLNEIIFDVGGGIKGGKKIKGAQTGGPSGGIISQNELDTPVDFGSLIKLGSMMGSGGMIVMDEDDCVVDVSKFYMEFCVDESCGKCSPCRIGTRQMHMILPKAFEIPDEIALPDGKYRFLFSCADKSGNLATYPENASVTIEDLTDLSALNTLWFQVDNKGPEIQSVSFIYDNAPLTVSMCLTV